MFTEKSHLGQSTNCAAVPSGSSDYLCERLKGLLLRMENAIMQLDGRANVLFGVSPKVARDNYPEETGPSASRYLDQLYDRVAQLEDEISRF